MYSEEDCKSRRKKQLVINIKSDKEGLTKDTLMLAGAALAIGAGALGVYFLGPDVIDKYFKWFSNDIALNFKSNLLLRLEAAGLATSLITIGAGIKGAVTRIKDIVSGTQDLNDHKAELGQLEEESREL